MDAMFLGIVVFLLLLAIVDLWVGVSNDAVNFLSSALGAKAASFRTILVVAAVGVLIGASLSGGMMDIARHGIFHPASFSFYDVICIFMAVMITDIILLDIFNSLGMPTSTTVSMVFELLGAATALALMKMWAAPDVALSSLINTDKAMQVIMGIFCSVAIAFVVGTVVGWLTRLVLTFDGGRQGVVKMSLFGGIAATAIVWFLLVKGASNLTFYTAGVRAWVDSHTLLILGSMLVTFSVGSGLLHRLCRVSVPRVVVLMGTFALAMAFAGNDLVNFIGVPLSGLSAYQDYAAHGGGEAHTFLMQSLQGSADTPQVYLVLAGVIMVLSLATSSKVKRVSQTTVGLSSQGAESELFGTSLIARRLVRLWIATGQRICESVPPVVREWVNHRFDTRQLRLEQGASFDMVRGAVNLVIAALLIALGTSLRLPLSTTFVTFMVAMGTSLADRAWGRESAVFRVTGVISVIGGWFLTAGLAFLGAMTVCSLMYAGGWWVMLLMIGVAVVMLVRSNMRYKKREQEEHDSDFSRILAIREPERVWPALQPWIVGHRCDFLSVASGVYRQVCAAFADEDVSALSRSVRSLKQAKGREKMVRQRETLCLRQAERTESIQRQPWVYVGIQATNGMVYNLRHIADVCLEHVDNHFPTLPVSYAVRLKLLRTDVLSLLAQSQEAMRSADKEAMERLRGVAKKIQTDISTESREIYEELRSVERSQTGVIYVYLNLIMETQDMLSSLRKMLRAGKYLS